MNPEDILNPDALPSWFQPPSTGAETFAPPPSMMPPQAPMVPPPGPEPVPSVADSLDLPEWPPSIWLSGDVPSSAPTSTPAPTPTPPQPVASPDGLDLPEWPPSSWLSGDVPISTPAPAPTGAAPGQPPAPPPVALDARGLPDLPEWPPSHWFTNGAPGQAAPASTPSTRELLDPYSSSRASDAAQAAPAAPPSTRELLDPYSPEADAAAILSMDPEQAATEAIKADARREEYLMELRLQEMRKDRERAEANERLRREAHETRARQLQEIDRDLQQLQRTTIDPNRWWQSRGTGQKVASYAAAMIAGLLSPGGRNGAIEAFQQAIDQDIQAQQANLSNAAQTLNQRRGIVGELYANSQDAYRAAETARLAAMEQFEQQLAMEQMKYDPQGTIARRIADGRAEVRAAAAQQRAKFEQDLLTRAEQEARVRKTMAETALLERKARPVGTGTGAGGTLAPDDRRLDTVYVPNTDIELRRFTGKSAEKNAAEANDRVSYAMKSLQLINQLEATIEDYGQRGLLESAEFTKSNEYTDLEKLRQEAAIAKAKAIAGPGFSTTESDQQVADRLLPLPERWWEARGKALTAIRRVKQVNEDDLRLSLNRFLNSDQQNRLIQQARARSTSKNDLAEEAELAWMRTAADATKPSEERAEALRLAVATAKKQVDGTDESWAMLAVNQLRQIREQVLSEPEGPARRRVLTSLDKKLVDLASELRDQRKQRAGKAITPSRVAGMQGAGGQKPPSHTTGPEDEALAAIAEIHGDYLLEQLSTFRDVAPKTYRNLMEMLGDTELDGDEGEKLNRQSARTKKRILKTLSKTPRRKKSEPKAGE